MAHLYNSQLDAFELYHRIREDEGRSHTSSVGPALPALGHAISGSAGAAISNLLIYPLDLVITRLQAQKQYSSSIDVSEDDNADSEYTDIQDAVRKIYNREGGAAAFYGGVWQDTAKTIADSFLLFLAYNFLRMSRQRARGGVGKALPIHEELGVGMLAGAFAKFFTTPVQNIVTRKQTAAMLASRSRGGNSTSPELSARDIALQIRDEKGLLGFWSGYSATLVLTLNPALTFLFHEALTRSLIPRRRRENPGQRITFMLAALSKAMASSITYPFSLAKTRSQVSSQAPTVEPKSTSESTSGKESAIGKEGMSHVARARQSTVFSTIIRIAREEGVASLYRGLEGEVLKGFFSHGLTMLIKERVHAVIIRLYYLVLKTLQRYPSPREVVEGVKDKVNKKATAPTLVTAAMDVKEAAEKAQEQAGEVFEQGADAAKELLWGIIDEDDDGGTD